MWSKVDEAILQMNQGKISKVSVAVDPNVAVPPWESLPYVCTDELCVHFLPKCTAKDIVVWCTDESCKLHDEQRRSIETHGTVQDLLESLPAWTCPVTGWTITLESTSSENLGKLSHETRRVWEEVSRVFSLSASVRPGDVFIDVSAEHLGTLSLCSSEGTYRFYLPLFTDLIVLQMTMASWMLCTLSWPTRTTKR